MRIAVFSTKPYYRRFLDAANATGGHEFVYLESRLTLETAVAAEGAEAVCVFVNDVLRKEVLEALLRRGIRLVVLRCAGFNNVDLVAANSRHEGREACIALWTEIATSPGTFFELEDVTAMGERGIIRWRYHWGQEQSVRGVNLMHVRDGLIVEAQGYVKGGH